MILLAALVGYLCGSISFARLITRRFAPQADLRRLEVPIVGTGETELVDVVGANAASMVLGPRLGLAVALLDILKVVLPALAFRLNVPDQPYYLIASVAGLVGHNWPLYHRFRGGRGFSAILGGLLVVDWPAVLITPALGMLLGLLVFRNVFVAYICWLWLLVPWFWLRTEDPGHLLYALALNLVFHVATLPEIRTVARLRREGKWDAYVEGMMASSPRWRGMAKISQRLGIRRR
jgi:glycerol-3-phosphate acyltransferase PlsY